MSLCIGSRIVSSAIWIKHARVGLKEHQNSTSPKDGCYLRSLKKLTSACFIQILRETILLRINNIHKNVRDNCSFNLRL